MILDKHGRPMSVDDQFESFDKGDIFDALKGGSEQVLGEAFLLDTGKALTEKDLFTEGSYTLHHAPGQYILLAHKFADGSIRFEAKVYKTAEEIFDRELQADREANEHRPMDEKVKWNAPPWIIALALFEHNVNPEDDMEKFEKVLYTYYPKYWIDEARAPKY